MRTKREVRDGAHIESTKIFMEIVVPISYIGKLVMSTSMLYYEASCTILV